LAELTTVYKSRPDDVSKIVQLLQSRDLHPVVVDDAGKMGTYRDHEIRIAVPVTERDLAVQALAEAQRVQQVRVSELAKGTKGVILLLIIVLAFVAVVAFLDEGGMWFGGVSILLTAVAAVALIRWAWRRK
jgi:hypothetical protein